jgi:hypothetical protein
MPWARRDRGRYPDDSIMTRLGHAGGSPARKPGEITRKAVLASNDGDPGARRR